MIEMKKVSLEALFDKRAPQQMVSESKAFKTVPKGVYRLRATKYEATQDPKTDRVTIWFAVDILGPDGQRLAKTSLKISPDVGRNDKGNLDTQAKMYGQLISALYSSATPEEQGQVTAAELVQTFMQVPVDGFIALSFKGPIDPATGYPTWMNTNSDAEEIEARKQGFTAVNMVRSLQKAQ